MSVELPYNLILLCNSINNILFNKVCLTPNKLGISKGNGISQYLSLELNGNNGPILLCVTNERCTFVRFVVYLCFDSEIECVVELKIRIQRLFYDTLLV